MKILDRYIIKQFLQMTGFALVAFTVIFVVVDMMENLDDFIDRDVPFTTAIQYYLYFMPEIIKLMVPVAVLLSSLFTTGRLSTFNEISAMKASGISLYRFMLPMLIVALLITGASIYFNGWVVPYANQKKFTIARVHLNKYIESWGRYNIFIQDNPTRIVSLGFFDAEINTANRVSIQDFSPGERTRMIARFDARQMVWDSTNSVWVLVDCTRRTFEEVSASGDVHERSETETIAPTARIMNVPSRSTGSTELQDRGRMSPSLVVSTPALRTKNVGTVETYTDSVADRPLIVEREEIAYFDTLMFVGLHFIPSEIKKKQGRPDELDYYDLRNFIENQKRAGQEVARWEVDFHSKIAFPFASFIVVLFGVPFSSMKRRSGLAVEFGLSLGICFLYLAFMKISHTFGYKGDIDPLVTAWLANFVFFAAGMVNLWRVRK